MPVRLKLNFPDGSPRTSHGVREHTKGTAGFRLHCSEPCWAASLERLGERWGGWTAESGLSRHALRAFTPLPLLYPVAQAVGPRLGRGTSVLLTGAASALWSEHSVLPLLAFQSNSWTCVFFLALRLWVRLFSIASSTIGPVH